MSRLARLAVATLAITAALTPLLAGAAPRGLIPAQGATPTAAAAWGAGMTRNEPNRPAASPRLCNKGRGAWTRAEIRCAIRRTFPSSPSVALCIAVMESRLDPRAVGNAGERGLMQIHPVHRAWLGGRWAKMFDPVENLRAARDLYRMSGYSWRPWSTAGACT